MKNNLTLPYYFNNQMPVYMANYQDTLQDLNNTYEEIKQNIQSKYDKVIGEIAELDKKIQDLYTNSTNNSKQWINQQISIIKNKINKKKEALEKWLKQKLEDAQKWLDGVMDMIKQKIADMIISMLNALK